MLLEHRLGEFVDRTDEMGALDALVNRSREQSIAVVWGGESCGKSSLIMRMRKAVEQHVESGSLFTVHIDWHGAGLKDYLGVIREVKKQLGEKYFATFNPLVSRYFNADRPVNLKVETGPISLLQNAEINGTIETVAAVVIDYGSVVPRQDVALDDLDRVRILTGAFLEDLAKLAETKPVLFFLDTFEKASENTVSWLWGDILEPIRAGTVKNLLFVVSGRSSPPTYRGWGPRDIIDLELPPLKRDDIKDYLRRRGVEDPAVLTFLAPYLWDQTEGKAGVVASHVDGILQALEKDSKK